MMCEDRPERFRTSLSNCSAITHDDDEVASLEAVAIQRESLSQYNDSNQNKSIRISELLPESAPTPGRTTSAREDSKLDSLSALGNMSFAAWESNRQSWKCGACTFVNEPRYLMCGACGMSEGSISEECVEDELIQLGLQRMSLGAAQNFLMNAVHKQLDEDAIEGLQQERADELLKVQMRDVQERELEEASLEASRRLAAEEGTFSSNTDEIPNVQQSSMTSSTSSTSTSCPRKNIQKQIETLERIQRAEKLEHDEMFSTLEHWQLALTEEPDAEQEVELARQGEMLQKLVTEWKDRETELHHLRMRLEGDLAIV